MKDLGWLDQRSFIQRPLMHTVDLHKGSKNGLGKTKHPSTPVWCLKLNRTSEVLMVLNSGPPAAVWVTVHDSTQESCLHMEKPNALGTTQ